MLAFPYFDRVGDQSVVLDNGEKYDRIIATRGKDYLFAYNYTGRPMRVDLGKISGKDIVLIAIDSERDFLTPDTKSIPAASTLKSKTDLNE